MPTLLQLPLLLQGLRVLLPRLLQLAAASASPTTMATLFAGRVGGVAERPSHQAIRCGGRAQRRLGAGSPYSLVATET